MAPIAVFAQHLFAPRIQQPGANAVLVRHDLRHQLSAYLDVVTMRLAGNEGNEGALKKSAADGEGRLFVELRRRVIDAETSGRPLVTARPSRRTSE